MADAPRASARVASKCVELWGCLAYSSNALRSTRPAETITWRSKAMNPLNNHRQSLNLGILGAGVDDPTHYFLIIGTGAWLGTIMLFNVWVLIWPNQKKILGVVAATDEEKARARKVAGMASRVNFVLSIPMLMCMAAASHGLPFIH